MPGARLLLLDCPPLASASRPGQFLMVLCGPSHDPYLRYPVPIHRFTATGVSLLVRATCAELRWLGTRQVGERIDVLGPCGRGVELLPAAGTLGLVAQSRGLAPLLSLVDRAECVLQLIAEAPTVAQLYPRELLPQTLEYLPFVGTENRDAFIEALARICRWAQRIYAAGSPQLYRTLRRTLEADTLGLRPGRAFVWVEAELACGLGACQGCALQTRRGVQRVCRDGPFMDLADLIE